MYGHIETSTNSNLYNDTSTTVSVRDNGSEFKDTLHISPHIAAHKSSSVSSHQQHLSLMPSHTCIASVPVSSTILGPDLTTYKIFNHESVVASGRDLHPQVNNSKSASHGVTIHRKDIGNSALFPPGTIISSTHKNNIHSLTDLTHIVPEDLSAASESSKISHDVGSSQNNNFTGHSKPLPHIYTVAGAGQVSSLFPGIVDRTGGNLIGNAGSNTYFRATESPGIPGQPQAILVSNVVGCTDDNHDSSSSHTPLAAMPPSTLLGEVLGVVETHIKKEPIRDNCQAAVIDCHQQYITQQQRGTELRQAIHVALPGQKNNEEVIEYSYTATDIADLLMMNLPGGLSQTVRQMNGASNHSSMRNNSENILGATEHSISVVDAVSPVIMVPACVPTSINTELISSETHIQQMTTSSLQQQNTTQQLMQGQVISSDDLNDTNRKLTSTPVCSVFDSAVSVRASVSISPSFTNTLSMDSSATSPRTKRQKLRINENDHSQKKEKLAQLMREKRANESEEQKARRRVREAERMRRRRSLENEEQKTRRRQEAAQRARMRRASMTPDERKLDRLKAAERMRKRRRNEGEQQKMLRRKRAAERMRRRRAEESPEQRAHRKQNVFKIKTRRRKKQEITSRIESDDSLLAEDIKMFNAVTELESISQHELSHNFASTSVVSSAETKAGITTSTLCPQLSLQHCDVDQNVAIDNSDGSEATYPEGKVISYGVITAGGLIAEDSTTCSSIKKILDKQDCGAIRNTTMSEAFDDHHTDTLQRSTAAPVIKSFVNKLTSEERMGVVHATWSGSAAGRSLNSILPHSTITVHSDRLADHRIITCSSECLPNKQQSVLHRNVDSRRNGTDVSSHLTNVPFNTVPCTTDSSRFGHSNLSKTIVCTTNNRLCPSNISNTVACTTNSRLGHSNIISNKEACSTNSSKLCHSNVISNTVVCTTNNGRLCHSNEVASNTIACTTNRNRGSQSVTSPVDSNESDGFLYPVLQNCNKTSLFTPSSSPNTSTVYDPVSCYSNDVNSSSATTSFSNSNIKINVSRSNSSVILSSSSPVIKNSGVSQPFIASTRPSSMVHGHTSTIQPPT